MDNKQAIIDILHNYNSITDQIFKNDTVEELILDLTEQPLKETFQYIWELENMIFDILNELGIEGEFTYGW